MTQEFVTLPREVVELAIEAMKWAFPNSIRLTADHRNSIDSLRAALERPQDNQDPVAWLHTDRLGGKQAFTNEPPPGMKALCQPLFYRAMLDAAPKPPTVKDSLTVEQPQANQPAMTPIAQRKLEDLVAGGYTISGYSIYHEQKHQHGFVTGAGLVGWWKPEGVEYPQPLGEQEPVSVARVDDLEGGGRVRALAMNLSLDAPLYTRPQPKHTKRKPLSEDEILDIWEEKYMSWIGGGQFVHIFQLAEFIHNIK